MDENIFFFSTDKTESKLNKSRLLQPDTYFCQHKNNNLFLLSCKFSSKLSSDSVKQFMSVTKDNWQAIIRKYNFKYIHDNLYNAIQKRNTK